MNNLCITKHLTPVLHYCYSITVNAQKVPTLFRILVWEIKSFYTGFNANSHRVFIVIYIIRDYRGSFMKKLQFTIPILLTLLFVSSGCTPIGDKTLNMSAVYIVTSFLSLLMLVGYFFLIKKKETWFFILFTSVFIVNAGYFTLSISNTLEMALWANRVSYLGSVILPLSMIMIITKVSGLQQKKSAPYILTAISVVIFLIAATPGYLDIYYKSVTLEIAANGVSSLNKEYGPLHPLYLLYLLSYFIIMISTIVHAIFKKKLESVSHAILLLVAVFVNICVWLLEQLVKIDFEFLSVSYIITELFLISAYLMIQHQEVLISSLEAKLSRASESRKKEPDASSPEFIEHCNYIKEQLSSLTHSEYAIYSCYLEGKSTKEVMEKMNITENTLKFHNKNIYGKLGVSSRKQLLQYAKSIEIVDKNKV